MTLARIPNGEIVLIDANVFIYALLNRSNECKKLLSRCSEKLISGIITTHVLAEIMHRLMMIEARENGWITAGNPAQQLGQKPERVKILYRYEQSIKNILAIGLRFEPVEKRDFITAMRIQREAGVLTNDALLAAVAERLRVQSIVSADYAFSRVRGIVLYSPNDVGN
jgi:predicted nucleic acid-binding protein